MKFWEKKPVWQLIFIKDTVIILFISEANKTKQKKKQNMR